MLLVHLRLLRPVAVLLCSLSLPGVRAINEYINQRSFRKEGGYWNPSFESPKRSNVQTLNQSTNRRCKKGRLVEWRQGRGVCEKTHNCQMRGTLSETILSETTLIASYTSTFASKPRWLNTSHFIYFGNPGRQVPSPPPLNYQVLDFFSSFGHQLYAINV